MYNSNKIQTKAMQTGGGNNITANGTPDLFPITVSYNNTSIATQNILITGGCRTSGSLALSNPWTLTITETQN